MEKQFFIDRIKKRIYRKATGCQCYDCLKIERKGIIVLDLEHAEYLRIVSNELGIIYFDKNI